METNNILKAILRMSEDDNNGLRMSLKVLDVNTDNGINKVTFQVDDAAALSASLQSKGLSGSDMCCAFFINRKELKKYKL